MSIGIFTLSSLIGRRPYNRNKLSPYECGVKGEGSARLPFQNRFYLIAVLFLLFDVEGALLFPWALIYRESLAQGGALLFAGMVYIGFVIIGFLYVLKKRALELS